ncbi:MAG: phage/plasmid primase, P4 family [Lachnospiraceae bacterium]|nr:phage/plasmid primase, P4 family [Lachnospiraceae bacterium]
MHLTLFYADCVGRAANCSYPHKVIVDNPTAMEGAVAHDHVCATYKNNYRSIDNFQVSDVIPMDIDNDHSDNPADWITEEKMDELFGSIDYVLVPSRHHMLDKDGKSARPRYHVYFPIEKCTDTKLYSSMKVALQKAYPFFDDNALDSARFMFGSTTDEVVWHEGWMFITDDLDIEGTADEDEEDFDGSASHGPITEGNRNNFMSRFGSRVLKKYGECDKAHEVFLEQAAKCEPPLDDSELATIWFSALKFFRNKISKDGGYVPPDQYNDDFGDGAGSLKPEDYSDVGQAKVLSREYGDELKFTAATDFIRFDGEVWVEDRQMAVGACVEFLDLQLQDAKDCIEEAQKALVKAGYDESAVKQGSKAIAKDIKPEHLAIFYMLVGAEKYLAFAMKRRDYKYITSALNVAKSMLTIKVSDLDKDPNLLNTPRATYNLETGVEQPHDPFDLITKITECSPGDEGMDIWLEALETFFCGDAELIEYVQKVIGLAAIGKVYEEFIIIAYGDGANGKSTFWNTIARVLGTYSGKISSDILTMGNKVNAQPEMAELKGKRLIIASEMQEGVRLNTAMVKQLCSTDEIQACKKYKDPFHFVPSHQVVLYTNHLPKVGANDDGIWRRLKVIPFNAKIKGNSDIKNYADYLYEKAAPAIMKWIIEGAEKVGKTDHKVDDPKCVVDAVAAYRDDNDWLGHFITDCCDLDDTYEEKSGELYQQYRAYCIQNGEYIRSTTDFYAAIEKAGYFRHKTNKGSFVHGVKLKTGSDFI